MAIPIRQKEIDATEKDKKFWVSMEKLEKESRGILCLPKVTDTYVGRELDILLKWYGTPSLSKLDVPSKKAEWQQILDEKREPPAYEKWTADDEARLDELKKREIDIADTVLGRHRAVQKREMMASVATMSKEELDELQKKIDNCKTPEDEEPGATLPAATLPPPTLPAATTNPSTPPAAASPLPPACTPSPAAESGHAAPAASPPPTANHRTGRTKRKAAAAGLAKTMDAVHNKGNPLPKRPRQGDVERFMDC